jgi:hypothetical protein
MYEESSKTNNLINHTYTTSKIVLAIRPISIGDNFVYAPHLLPSVTQAELFSLWPFLLSSNIHHLAPAANPRDENSGAGVFPNNISEGKTSVPYKLPPSYHIIIIILPG